MGYQKIVVPADGDKITVNADLSLNVPNYIVAYIEGDGIGVDITPVMLKVVDAAVSKAYGNSFMVLLVNMAAKFNSWTKQTTIRDVVSLYKSPYLHGLMMKRKSWREKHFIG